MDRENVLITKTDVHVNNEIEYISEESEDHCVDISTGLSSDDNILFIYPFSCPSERIENTAKDLREACGLTCKYNVDNKVVIWNNSQDYEIFEEKERNKTEKVIHPKLGKEHYLTVRERDFKRLEPEQFLNDTIIDFWMK